MTRRKNLHTIRVACASLVFVLVGVGCGPDEAAAPPRTTGPRGPSDAARSSSGQADDGGEGDDGQLCAVAAEAATDAQEALQDGSLVDVAFDFYERIEPHTDGRLREDIDLMVAAARASLAGEPISVERDVEVAEASARFMREMHRRCADLVLPGAA